MALPAPKPRFTPAEYLKLEEAAEVKHEYHAGEILAMSGGTYRHSLIIANMVGELRARLKGTPCVVLEGNMRVRLARDDRYVYPDATVVCGGPQFDPRDAKQTTIINPKVVIEVLSESTEAYDRGAKFTAYRELESLEGYVLVSQDRPQVETYTRRDGGTWLFTPWRGLTETATIHAVKIDLPLAEVYAGIPFEEGEASSRPPA